MTNKTRLQELDEATQPLAPFAVLAEPISVKYTIKLNDVFEDGKQFDIAVAAITEATEADLILLEIASDGGSLGSISALVGALWETQAHIHAKCSDKVSSAATVVALCADSISITPFTEFLIHTASYGIGGRESDIRSYVDFSTKQIARLLEDTYSNFLTEDEMTEVKKGHQLYLDAEDFGNRFVKMKQLEQGDVEKSSYPTIEEDIGDTPLVIPECPSYNPKDVGFHANCLHWIEHDCTIFDSNCYPVDFDCEVIIQQEDGSYHVGSVYEFQWSSYPSHQEYANIKRYIVLN